MELVHTKCLPTSLTICLCWQPPPHIVPKCPWLLKTVFCVWVVCVSSHMYVFLGCHFLEKCLVKGFIWSMWRYFRSFALRKHCTENATSPLIFKEASIPFSRSFPPLGFEMSSKRPWIYYRNTCWVWPAW